MLFKTSYMKKKIQIIVNFPASLPRYICELSTWLDEKTRFGHIIAWIPFMLNFFLYMPGGIYHSCLGKYSLPENNEHYSNEEDLY